MSEPIDSDVMLARLEALRKAVRAEVSEACAEPVDELILDVMDEVWGWCAPHRRLSRQKATVTLF